MEHLHCWRNNDILDGVGTTIDSHFLDRIDFVYPQPLPESDVIVRNLGTGESTPLGIMLICDRGVEGNEWGMYHQVTKSSH